MDAMRKLWLPVATHFEAKMTSGDRALVFLNGAIVALMMACGSAAHAQTADPASGAVTPVAPPPGAKAQSLPVTVILPVTLTRVAVRMPNNRSIYANGGGGFFCGGPSSWSTFPGGQAELRTPSIVQAFQEEMQMAGIPANGNNDDKNLFEPSSARGDIKIAALVTDMHVHDCNIFTPTEAQYKIQWQVYSVIRRRLIGTFDTANNFKIAKGGDLDSMEAAVVRDSVKKLIASPGFMELVGARPIRSP